MTPAKLEALRLLADGPRLTSAHTKHGLIGGRVAACLMRDGLATRSRIEHIRDEEQYRYQITEAGRMALATARHP